MAKTLVLDGKFTRYEENDILTYLNVSKSYNTLENGLVSLPSSETKVFLSVKFFYIENKTTGTVLKIKIKVSNNYVDLQIDGVGSICFYSNVDEVDISTENDNVEFFYIIGK